MGCERPETGVLQTQVDPAGELAGCSSGEEGPLLPCLVGWGGAGLEQFGWLVATGSCCVQAAEGVQHVWWQGLEWSVAPVGSLTKAGRAGMTPRVMEVSQFKKIQSAFLIVSSVSGIRGAVWGEAGSVALPSDN